MSESSRFQSDLAKIIRAVVVLVLGGKCEKCHGTLLSVLEVDHVDGRDWSPRSMGSLKRALRYLDELESFLKTGTPRLRVLCRRCNAIDGANRGNHHIPDPPEYPKICDACGYVDCKCVLPF
jgi:hypothetical protein